MTRPQAREAWQRRTQTPGSGQSAAGTSTDESVPRLERAVGHLVESSQAMQTQMSQLVQATREMITVHGEVRTILVQQAQTAQQAQHTQAA